MVDPSEPSLADRSRVSPTNPLRIPQSRERFNSEWLELSLYNTELLDLGQAALDWTGNVLRNVAAAPHLLVVCGPNGIGKTRVLRGCHRCLKAMRIGAWASGWWPLGPLQLRYADWNLWANLDWTRSDSDYLQFEDLCDPSVLLLDDVGSEVDKFRSGLALANLSELLTRREGKWTAITTNFFPEKWVGTEAAPGRFGKRVGDRLFRNSTIVCLRHTPSWSVRKARP